MELDLHKTLLHMTPALLLIDVCWMTAVRKGSPKSGRKPEPPQNGAGHALAALAYELERIKTSPEFDQHGLMHARIASINDLPIKESERK